MAKKILIGFLILVILSSSIYILLPDNIRIDVEKTKTTFKVWENESWILAGTERTILFDGTKKMRAKSREINYFVDGNKTKIVRTAYFKDNITAIDTYLFDGGTKDIELYPVEHIVEILNGKGKLFVYEVNDLEYSGETIKGISSPQMFGHQMKVEWQDGNYYSKIFKYKDKDVGKLTIKYRVNSDYEKYHVRLFDPPWDYTGTKWSLDPYNGDSYGMTYNDTHLFVTQRNETRVFLYLTDGTYTGTNYDVSGGCGIATDNNYFWVGGPGTTVYKYFMNGTNTGVSFSVAGVNADIRGLTTNGTFIWVNSDATATNVSFYEMDGTYVGDFSTSDIGGPMGMTNNGTFIWVTDIDNDEIYQYWMNGTYTQKSYDTSTSGNNQPHGVALNETYFWVNDNVDNEVYLYEGGSYPPSAYPNITLNSPVNYTNSTTKTITFNCSASDDLNLINLSLILDGSVNETNSSGYNNSFYYFTKNLAEGDIYWSCRGSDNDSQFTTPGERLLSVDIAFPILSIDYPGNITYGTNVSDLNYTIIETNPSYCWYSLDGATNSSLQTCMDNWTNIVSVEGNNTWIVYGNDTFGQENSTNVSFFKDSIIPLISFNAETESNAKFSNQSFIYANVSATETNEQNITFEVYWQNGTLVNSSVYTDSRREINWTGLDYGTYLYNVTIFDVINSNSTETRTIYLSDIFLFFEGNEGNLSIELNTPINITGNSSTDFGLICIDIDHPDYGDNYTCSNKEFTFNFTFDYFRKLIFWDGLFSKLFSFTGGFQVDDENLTLTSHRYAEVDDLRFNISSSDDAENVVFYRCNTTIFDRAYKGFLVGNHIYLNQSINSAEDTFRNYENITFDDPGNRTIYFYLDDNTTIQNITMNVTGKNYGFSSFDDFTNFSDIDVYTTSAQLHYGPGGFIQSPNSSLSLRTFDDFNDGIVYSSQWLNSSTGSIGGVRETGGYLEAYASVSPGSGGTSTKIFYPNSLSLWYFTSDYISFSVDAYSIGNEDSISENDCHNTGLINFANQQIWSASPNRNVYGDEGYTADLDFELTKMNHTYWEINTSGTNVYSYQSTEDCDGVGGLTITYNYTNGSIFTDWSDQDCTDTWTSLSNSSIFVIDEAHTVLYFSNALTVDVTGWCNDGASSYLRLDNIKNKMWNRTNGTVTSDSIFDSNTNIVSSTFNYSSGGSTTANYSATQYLSANDGVNWEQVSNGVEHTFAYPGKHIKWKLVFNTTTPGYQNRTVHLVNVTIETQESAVSDLEFDFGDDGIWDYKLNGTFNESNNSLIISMPNVDISGSFATKRKTNIGGQSYDHTYRIPLRISSESAGQIDLDLFNITYDPNPVILNYTSIQDYLDSYGSNESNFTIPIGGINGSVNVSDIQFDYAGGMDSIAITIRDVLNTINLTRYIHAYYSRWDYMFVPIGVDYIFFNPESPTTKNATPYGQTDSVPIFNLTNYGYGGKNTILSIYQNSTLSCTDTYLSTNNTKPLASLWDDLVGYYPFDLDTNDWSGFDNDGTVTGATFNFTGGQLGGAYEFDGVNDYINLSDNSDIKSIGTGNFTISVWIKNKNPTKDSEYHQPIIISKTWGTGNWGFDLSNGHHLRFHWDTTEYKNSGEFEDLNDDVWYNVIVKKEDNLITLYVDNVAGTSISGVSSKTLSTNENVYLGMRIPSSGHRQFNGTIDEVRIYNRSLTTGEISTLYERSYNKYYDSKLTDDWRTVNQNIGYLGSTDIWLWSDYDCSYNNWYLFNPFFSFRQCCDGCECSEDLE